jgi:hypothetical protein
MKEGFGRLGPDGISIVDASVPEIGVWYHCTPHTLINEVCHKVDDRETQQVQLSDALQGQSAVMQGKPEEPIDTLFHLEGEFLLFARDCLAQLPSSCAVTVAKKCGDGRKKTLVWAVASRRTTFGVAVAIQFSQSHAYRG